MSTNKLNPQDYIAKRFGLKYDPPQIILEYLVPSTGKLYHHKIKLDFMSSDSNVSDVLDIIQKKHHTYFTNNKITSQQVEKLIYKMKQYLPKKPIKQIESINQNSNYKIINENKNQYLAQQPQISQIINKNNSKQIEQTSSMQSLLKTSQNDNKNIFQKPTLSQVTSQTQNTQFANISQQSKADEKGEILQTNKNIANNVIKPSPLIQVQQKKMEKDESNQYNFSLSDYDSTEEKVSAPVKPIVQTIAQLKQQSAGVTSQVNNSQKQQQEQKNNSSNVANKIETKKNDFEFDDLSDFEDEEESKPATVQESKQITKQTQQSSKPSKQEEKEEEEEMYEEIYEEDFESVASSATKIDYNNTDLNKLSKEELDKHKAIMDKDFNKNQKKPGDKDFVYDKRQTFVQNEENEWDEEL
ncbi:hypothetical protein TTHERM_00616640 (macronuclear) [Tetrahymena thermophila SB210]|uniref:Centrosomal protein of 19 kDa n=1 Tax=Tetrahymena thermophila (strain SB210) TaxID=312017 RepID=I7M3X7_TETTS|nr:hypothetical protein TTHERM_00616640 [Tetrahymena thermophila SB210]EAS04489.2 hypothetical protein TTHERM_00616640 [Tetrahymena thermophila SB210]|eukprot:XP_001024734.2 hypothetical protein TTHERM_00616640 [Tetrahymena thermophila SB210]